MIVTLYKKDTKGRIRVLKLETVDNVLFSASGILGSALTTTEKAFQTTKGKAGEAKAATALGKKILDKKRTGWVLTQEEAEHSTFIPRPQLLSPYYKHSAKVKYPCIAQPKLDGVRCLWDRDGNFITRNGLNLECLARIHPTPYDYLDGELYCHGMPLQDIISCTRKLSSEVRKISFIIFDAVNVEDTRPYRERLLSLITDLKGDTTKEKVDIIETKVIQSVEELDTYYADCISRGFEGIVVKDMDAQYEWNRRVTHQLKRKPTFTGEFKITRVEWERRGADELIEFLCCTKDNLPFKVIPAWSVPQRIDAMKKQREAFTAGQPSLYHNKMLTVEYKSVSKDGIPLHAVGIAIREDL